MSNIIKNEHTLNLEEEIEVQLENIQYGHSSNIEVYCSEVKSDYWFKFSVFYNNKYSSRSGDFNFKEIKDKFDNKNKPKLILKLEETKNGFLNCISARLK
ncbi:hypothetical protein [Aliarcobacter skirrowii]|uniref:hypothetical protein n=1 Tax=Aliarcobacter skirrowii TaxID=28200 RepID=UPI0029A4E968|nr:hypothetical protein [Aliarcobacter skirrowii]MDX4028377.1 hypothetical protein [Aliarcobacter skirrowii]